MAIDITGKKGRNKLTDNSNFFCLGPAGSGKSFHMNSVVRQLWEQNTDVVMWLIRVTLMKDFVNTLVVNIYRCCSGFQTITF